MRMLDYVRAGDVIICTKLCRIGRSTADILKLLKILEENDVSFRCLNISLDSSTPTGKLMITMLAAVATFEREIMLERQMTGFAAAKAAGKYRGRKPTARAQAANVVELISQGKTKQAIANELAIGIASVYRIIKSLKRAI